MNYIIGVDIGGTKIAAGLVTEKGALKKRIEVPTLASSGFHASISQVYKVISDLISFSDGPIKGIGLAAPGPLDPVKGVVHNPPNLAGWREVALKSLVEKKFKKSAKLENDANAAAFAESVWGAAKGYKNVFYVTVSTGIGTGIITDGRIFHGANGMAGEAGHVTINYDAENASCNCGSTGCIEALASGPGTVKRLIRKLADARVKTNLIKMAGGRPENITMALVGKAAKRKDKLALEVIAEEGELLGIWLGSMINVLDPDIIVIGGGVSLVGGILFTHIRKAIRSHTINVCAPRIPVVQAALKKDAGVFGAASLFIKSK